VQGVVAGLARGGCLGRFVPVKPLHNVQVCPRERWVPLKSQFLPVYLTSLFGIKFYDWQQGVTLITMN